MSDYTVAFWKGKKLEDCEMTKFRQFKQWLKEVFYRREVEIFREGMTNTYGIREVVRCRFKRPDGISGWRDYLSRSGGTRLSMSYEEMDKLIQQAKYFVKKMK